MKKILLSLLLVLGPVQAGLAAERDIYVPIDHVRVPELGAGWTSTLPESNVRVEYRQRSEKGLPEGIYKSSVKLVRESLSAQERNSWVWQAGLRRDLQKEFGKVQTESLDKKIFRTSYEYTEDLIPLVGTRFYFPYAQWLYSWQCDLEQDFARHDSQWCLKSFQAIRWSDQLKIQPSKKFSDFEKFTQKLPLNKISLDRVQLGLTAHLQSGELSLNELHEYGYYLIFESLLFPPEEGEEKTVFMDHLSRLSHSLAGYEASNSMRAWLDVHQRFLENSLSYDDAEKLVQQDQRPPYWLLSLWMRGVHRETSLYLARRQKLGTTLQNYVLGKILRENKQAELAIPYLKKALGGKNTLPLMELALAYWDLGQMQKAEQIARQSLRKEAANIEPWLLLAQIEAQDKEGENDAEKIYLQLMARGGLSRGDMLKIHLHRAKHAPNPSIQLAFYERVLELSPNNLEALYSLGRLYLLEENDKHKGVKLFERYLQVAPRHDERVEELVAMVRELKSELHRYDWKSSSSYSYHD